MMRNRFCRTLLVGALLTGVWAATGASPAAAVPSGEYAVFYDCPLSNPELAACLASRSESGEITIGKQTVPITNTQTLQGGFIEEFSGALLFVGAADGNTLSKSPQKVPGGLAGLVKCNEIKGLGLLETLARAACELVFENGATGVNATTELAAPASDIGLNEENILSEKGVGLSLPIKVRLENPLLGSECYIGSNSNPVTIELTSGTSGSVKGKLGNLSSRAEGGILVIKNNTLVSQTFAAPAATGCGGIFASLIDPLVNSKVGLPSEAGANTAILNNTVEQAGADFTREEGE
jgi:hypothetical protein